MSEALKLESPWAEVKEKIKETNPDLSDEDLDYRKGEEDVFLKKLSEKLNRTPEEVRGWVESVSFNKSKAG